MRNRIRDAWRVLMGRSQVERRAMIVHQSITEEGKTRLVVVAQLSMRTAADMSDLYIPLTLPAPCGEFYKVLVSR